MYLPKEMPLLLYTELDVKPHALGRETHAAPKVLKCICHTVLGKNKAKIQ